MANFIQLNQGLSRLGNIAADVGSFIQNERQLDLASRRQTMDEESAKIVNEGRAYDLRMKKMGEHGRNLMATINEAVQSRKPDGTKFNTLGEYLDSDQGVAAVDRMVSSLADTNSEYKRQLGGRPVRAQKNADGRYQVMVQDGEQWSPTDVTFSGEELAQKGRLDAASAGLAELIYFKRDADRKLAAGELSPTQHREIVTQIQQQGSELLDGAERVGIPRDTVIQTSRKGGEGYSQMVSEDQLHDYAAAGGGTALGGDEQEVVDEVGGSPRLGNLDAYMPERREGQSAASHFGESVGGLVRGTAGAAASSMLGVAKGIAEPIVDTTGGVARGVLGLTDGNPGETRAENPIPPAAQVWTQAGIPTTVTQKNAVTPTPQNTAPGPTQIRVARAERSLDQAINGTTEDARDAAMQYANTSVIMGVQPNPEIMANLYAGDDMRGSGREAAVWQAKMDMDFAKSMRTAQRTGTQDLTNQLKIRDQILQEQEQASENAAQRAVRAGAKDRSEVVKQLKGSIFSSYGTYRNEFANLGFDTAALPQSMSTFPMVADLLAKYHSRDMADRAHNANPGWFGTVKSPKTLMAYINKTIATADPAGTFATIRQGLAASPGNANLTPDQLDEAAREIFRSFNDPDIDLEAQP